MTKRPAAPLVTRAGCRSASQRVPTLFRLLGLDSLCLEIPGRNRVEIESAHPIQEILASCRFKRDVGSEPAAVRQPATGSHTELR